MNGSVVKTCSVLHEGERHFGFLVRCPEDWATEIQLTVAQHLRFVGDCLSKTIPRVDKVIVDETRRQVYVIPGLDVIDLDSMLIVGGLIEQKLDYISKYRPK